MNKKKKNTQIQVLDLLLISSIIMSKFFFVVVVLYLPVRDILLIYKRGIGSVAISLDYSEAKMRL